MLDPWTTLGISRVASAREIKTAWRRAALQHHPDRGGNIREFLRAQAAYDLIVAGYTGPVAGPEAVSRPAVAGPVTMPPPAPYRHDLSHPAYNQEYLNAIYGWLGYYGQDGRLRVPRQQARRRGGRR